MNLGAVKFSSAVMLAMGAFFYLAGIALDVEMFDVAFPLLVGAGVLCIIALASERRR